MARHKSFNAWLADALEDLARMRRELEDAKRGLKDAEEACFARQPRGTGDKVLRGKIKYAILRYRTESERERVQNLVEKCGSCLRLQRERIVQAWHRHVQRSLKRIAGCSITQMRTEWRRIASFKLTNLA